MRKKKIKRIIEGMIKTCCADKNEGKVHEIAVEGYNQALSEVLIELDL